MLDFEFQSKLRRSPSQYPVGCRCVIISLGIIEVHDLQNKLGLCNHKPSNVIENSHFAVESHIFFTAVAAVLFTSSQLEVQCPCHRGWVHTSSLGSKAARGATLQVSDWPEDAAVASHFSSCITTAQLATAGVRFLDPCLSVAPSELPYALAYRDSILILGLLRFFFHFHLPALPLYLTSPHSPTESCLT